MVQVYQSATCISPCAPPLPPPPPTHTHTHSPQIYCQWCWYTVRVGHVSHHAAVFLPFVCHPVPVCLCGGGGAYVCHIHIHIHTRWSLTWIFHVPGYMHTFILTHTLVTDVDMSRVCSQCDVCVRVSVCLSVSVCLCGGGASLCV
jgi:hypothetical protein